MIAPLCFGGRSFGRIRIRYRLRGAVVALGRH
jgi:hypothetical protein